MMTKIISFVCDAGMGSSALGASLLRKKLKNSNLDYKVTNKSICEIENDDIIICHQQFLKQVAALNIPYKIYSVNNFMDDKEYERIREELMKLEHSILCKENIKLNCQADNSDQAIIDVGHDLVKAGYVSEPYIQGMLKRDHEISVYIGNDIAIPHGEYEVKQYIKKTGIVVRIYPDGIKWGNGFARIVIGIAANNEDHMQILENVATKLCEMETVEALIASNDVDTIYEMLSGK